MAQQKRESWWKAIDVPGLLGCIALVFSIYALFWYYSESVKGNIEPGEFGIDRHRVFHRFDGLSTLGLPVQHQPSGVSICFGC